jgi:hypothetical protein
LVEGPGDEPIALDRPQPGAQQARRNSGDQALDVEHPPEGPGVAGGEGVVPAQSLLLGLLSGQHPLELPAAGQAEVQGRPDPLGGQG